MTTKPLAFILLATCILAAACASPTELPQPTVTPTITPKSTITPSPIPTLTSTPQPAPTAFTLTPTPGAPGVVDFIYVKKAKCRVVKMYDPRVHYRVEISFFLQWPDVEGEEGYWLYRNGNRVAELPADTTLFWDYFDLVKPHRSSTYVIVAYNALGESRSQKFSFANPC